MKKLEAGCSSCWWRSFRTCSKRAGSRRRGKRYSLNKADIVGGAANMGMGPLGIGTRQQQAQMVDISVEKASKCLWITHTGELMQIL